MRTLHLGLILAACATTALALGIETIAWPPLTGGSIAAILAVKLLLEDAYEPRPVTPRATRPAFTTKGRRALRSTPQLAS